MEKYPICSTDELKVGDRIMIKHKPRRWSSVFNDINPLSRSIEFPHTLVIKKIRERDNHVAMTCGKYGWDLTSIVAAGCYRLDDEEELTVDTDDLIEIL